MHAIIESGVKNCSLHWLDDLSDESDNSHDWGFQDSFSETIYLLLFLQEIQQNQAYLQQLFVKWFLKILVNLKNVVSSIVYEQRYAIKNLIELSKLK